MRDGLSWLLSSVSRLAKCQETYGNIFHSLIPLLFLTTLQLARALSLVLAIFGFTRNLRPHSIPSLHGQWRTESCPSLVLMALSPGQLLLSQVANTLEFQSHREQEAQTSMGMSVSGNPEHYFLVSQQKLW